MEFDNGSNDFRIQSSEIKPNYTKTYYSRLKINGYIFFKIN